MLKNKTFLIFFRASNSVQIKSTDPGPKNSFCHFESSYTGPSGGTYTAPSVATGNSYASVYKFPFQSADLKESTTNSGPTSHKCCTHNSPNPAVPFKYSDSTNTGPYKYSDSICSANYESSCYSICNYNCDTNDSSSNSKSKNNSYFGSKDSRENDQLAQTLQYKNDNERQTSSPFQFDYFTLKERFKQLQVIFICLLFFNFFSLISYLLLNREEIKGLCFVLSDKVSLIRSHY